MRRIGLIIASGMGVGYIPWASGTFGSLWGVLLYYLSRDLSAGVLLGIWAALLGLSLLSSHYAEQALGDHDSSVIVIDEVIGYFTAVLLIPFHFWSLALGFALFRLFDIWKPGPIRWLDRRLPGAFGVVLDDVAAGLLANLCLRLLFHYWRPY